MLGRGISASALPYSRKAPGFLDVKPKQIIEWIVNLAKKGLTES